MPFAPSSVLNNQKETWSSRRQFGASMKEVLQSRTSQPSGFALPPDSKSSSEDGLAVAPKDAEGVQRTETNSAPPVW